MVEQLYHNPDIYRIYVPLPDNPLKYLNCYVLVSDGETLIIDTGFNRPECKQALFDGLDELQVDFAHTKNRFFSAKAFLWKKSKNRKRAIRQDFTHRITLFLPPKSATMIC